MTLIQLQRSAVDELLAARELGCLLQPGAARGRVYGGGTMAADYIIRVPAASYDVLVTRKPDGTLGLSTDFWHGSVAAVLGEGLERLVQEHQCARTIAEAEAQGYTVTREVDQAGEILLTIGGIQ